MEKRYDSKNANAFLSKVEKIDIPTNIPSLGEIKGANTSHYGYGKMYKDKNGTYVIFVSAPQYHHQFLCYPTHKAETNIIQKNGKEACVKQLLEGTLVERSVGNYTLSSSVFNRRHQT